MHTLKGSNVFVQYSVFVNPSIILCFRVVGKIIGETCSYINVYKCTVQYYFVCCSSCFKLTNLPIKLTIVIICNLMYLQYKYVSPQHICLFSHSTEPFILTISLSALELMRSHSVSVKAPLPTAGPPPFKIIPDSDGPGPQRGCQIALPCRYISSPSPNGSPHFVQLVQFVWQLEGSSNKWAASWGEKYVCKILNRYIKNWETTSRLYRRTNGYS